MEVISANIDSKITGFKFHAFIKSIKLHPNQRTFKVILSHFYIANYTHSFYGSNNSSLLDHTRY